MKNLRRLLSACCSVLICTFATIAQETAPPSRPVRTDTIRPANDQPVHDTARMRKGGSLAYLFADSSKLTSSDYQLQLEKMYRILSNVENKSDLGIGIESIQQRLADTDSVLVVLKDNVLHNSAALNIRNLQVFRSLLMNIGRDLKEHRTLLDSTENKLVQLRTSLNTLAKDTVLRQLWRDSAMRQQFAPQLKEMRETWRSGVQNLRESMATVNLLQTHTSSDAVAAARLLEKVNGLLNTSAARVFGKECNYLWEKDHDSLTQSARSSFAKAYHGEKRALQYYFKDSSNKRLFLLLIGTLFFIWMYRNIRTLRRMEAMHGLADLKFAYLPSNYMAASVVMMLAVAPLFDLHAPAAYIESVQFLMLVILTVICWKKWPRKLFMYWVVMVVLYIGFSFTHHSVDPNTGQRLWLILLNTLSVVFGLLFLSRMQQHLHLKGFLRLVIVLHNILNVLSVLCNIWGRFSLAQILGSAAIFGFTQAIGLAVFSRICMEAILLQIVSSRVRRGVQSRLEHEPVINGFRPLILFLVALLWTIVFTTNLNIYTSLLNAATDFLETPRNIGDAYFTVGGILLFFLIIWVAHLLQKYVGYFLGDTGADEEIQNKGQRSRLLVARLILLCLGYLLAVAASGIAMDKITIVLGALGVGIGLGLQNIVNNFVSGIVLIFDRPLQIGDVVEIGDKTGRVREIGLRSSTLLTRDGAEVIIPNGDILSQQIVNWTLSNNQQRIEMDLSVSGVKDMEQVATTIKKTVLASNHVFENREPQILFTKVNEDGFDLKLFFWCVDVQKSDQARSEILLLLHDRLQAENIQIN